MTGRVFAQGFDWQGEFWIRAYGPVQDCGNDNNDK